MKLADLSNPIALATIIAESNANSIAVNATGTAYASQEEGFPHITMIPEDNGGEAPHGLDFNGFLKMLSSHVFNIQNGSPETFNSAVSTLIGGYPKNAQLWLIDDNNSRLLKSTKDDNTDNFLTTPSVIGTSWVDAFPTKDYVDNNFVTLSTAQTITGTKTFEGQVKRQNSTIIKGTAPASAATTTIEFTDKNGIALGHIYHTYGTDKTSTTVLQAVKANASGDNDYANISVRYPPNGSPFTYCLTPTDTTSTSSKQIATVGWVNSVGNNVMHLTGAETAANEKTFTSATRNRILSADNRTGTFLAQNMKYTLGTTPSSNVLTQMQMRDSADDWASLWEHSYRSDGGTLTSLTCRRANKSASGSLAIGYQANGTVYTYAPASDVNNSIVTTVNKSKAQNGYFQLGNGLIIQWGTKTGSGTVTFPKAFTTYLSISLSTNDGVPNPNNITKTGFTAGSYQPGGTPVFNWIAIGY